MRMITLALAAVPLLSAAPRVPIEWEMPTAAFAGRKAILNLDRGARMTGVRLGVTPAAFTTGVEYSCGDNPLARGVHTIEREAIVELRVQERQIGWRVSGTVVGLLPGADCALPVSTPVPALLLLSAVTTGHLAGLVLDKRSRRMLLSEPALPRELPLELKEVPESQALPEPSAPEEGHGGMSHETCIAAVAGAVAAARRAAIAD